MIADELLNKAIHWLQDSYPDSTIVTEMSVAPIGNARIDVAAINDKEMVGIEIKGEGDSPTRLELQGYRYGQVAKKMWLLCTPDGTLADRCKKKKPSGWGLLEIRDGVARRAERYRSSDGSYVDFWDARESEQLNPWAMCGTLWREELYDLAVRKNLQPGKKARVGDLTSTIIDYLPVPEIHEAMIFQLRRRVWRKPVMDLRYPPPKDPANRKAPNRPIDQGRLDI